MNKVVVTPDSKPDPVTIEPARSQSTVNPRLLEGARPDQITEKFVQKCLSQDQRDFLKQMIKRGDAVTYMEAIGNVIDRTREEMGGS